VNASVEIGAPSATRQLGRDSRGNGGEARPLIRRPRGKWTGVDVLRAVKEQFDSTEIMAPGKLLPGAYAGGYFISLRPVIGPVIGPRSTAVPV